MVYINVKQSAHISWLNLDSLKSNILDVKMKHHFFFSLSEVILLTVQSWKRPGSLPICIQHWHIKSPSIWLVELASVAEIIQILCSQPAARLRCQELVSILPLPVLLTEDVTFLGFISYRCPNRHTFLGLTFSLDRNKMILMKALWCPKIQKVLLEALDKKEDSKGHIQGESKMCFFVFLLFHLIF